MTDPVTIETGVTYERAAIAQWLLRESTCPATHHSLVSFQLHPNKLVRSMLSDMGVAVAPLTPLPANGNLDKVIYNSKLSIVQVIYIIFRT